MIYTTVYDIVHMPLTGDAEHAIATFYSRRAAENAFVMLDCDKRTYKLVERIDTYPELGHVIGRPDVDK